MKILLILISFVLPAAGCKKNNEKPQAPPNPVMTYTNDVNLSVIQQAMRGFGGATVFCTDLTDNYITTLFSNSNNNQLGLTIPGARISSIINMSTYHSPFRNSGGLEKRIKFNLMRQEFRPGPHIASNIKDLILESAVNIACTSLMYNLFSLNISTFVSV